MRNERNIGVRTHKAGNPGLFTAGRWGTMAAGSVLAAIGLSRRSAAGVVLAITGEGLVLAGAKARPYLKPFSARSSMLLNCPPESAFQLWRNFEDLPRFMHHLQSVTNIGEKQYRWIAIGPAGTLVQWDAEIDSERQNELISWHTLPTSEITVNGRVEFRAEPNNRGTRIDVRVEFVPPAGPLGYALVKLFGKDPNFTMRQDLRRFKALVEAGEIPTTEGQAHGRRSAVLAALRVADPARTGKREKKVHETVSGKWRVA